MKATKVVVKKMNIEKEQGELLVSFVYRNGNNGVSTEKFFNRFIETIEKYEEFSGKTGQSILMYAPFPDVGVELQFKRLLLVGLGEIKASAEEHELYELLRAAGGSIAQQCRKSKIERLSLQLPNNSTVNNVTAAQYLTEGLLLGSYQFLKYKKEQEEEEKYAGLKKIEILVHSNISKTREGVARGVHASTAACAARDMANEPGNGWTPSHFAQYAKKLAKKHDLACTVLNKSEMVKLGFGGLLAVNQGSTEKPKCVILDYVPEESTDTILLVGKGLTFDSGGISIKPAQGMMDMKYDMCGGAAVLAAMDAIASERPGVRVVAIIPSTDNMNGGGALKPGDVITHYGGVTSEIENTDAEGRLILADAIAYGIEQFKPSCVIDLATLTGAIVIALGHHYSGLMSNNNKLAEKLIEAGQIAAEPLWRMPLGKMYVKQIKSQVADIKNTGGRPGGAITAAEYLHRFVGDTPWAHLDIAGTAWDFTEKPYIPKGPSGFGTRTLVELVRSWESGVLSEKK